MPVEEKPARKGRKAAGAANKRQFLTTMAPDVIKAVKQAALEDDTTASVILETAAKEWLKRRGSKAET